MHGNVIEVMLQTIVCAHLLDEVDFIEMSFLIDYENYVLVWSWLIMEPCPDVIREQVDAGVRIKFNVSRICQVYVGHELGLE